MENYMLAGKNDKGSLGQGNTERYSTFVEVPGIEGTIDEVLCATQSNETTEGAIIICNNGNLIYGVGFNNGGLFGLGNTTDQRTVKRLEHFEGVKKIAYNGYLTAIIEQNGELWVCGRRL